MPKGQRYSGECKYPLIEDIKENPLGYGETARK